VSGFVGRVAPSMLFGFVAASTDWPLWLVAVVGVAFILTLIARDDATRRAEREDCTEAAVQLAMKVRKDTARELLNGVRRTIEANRPEK
jgi:hypothetical protein